MRSLACWVMMLGVIAGPELSAQEVEAEAVATDRQELSVQAEEDGKYDPIRVGMSRYDWQWLAQRFDADGNGRVLRTEIPLTESDFDRLDQTWDGVLTASDFDWSSEGELCRRKETAFALLKSIDVNSDGLLSADEWQTLIDGAMSEDGRVSEEDLERLIYLPRVLKAQSEYRSRATHVEFRLDDEGNLPTNLPEPGDLAPDFELQSPDGQQTIRLSSFRGERPVVLIFGCLTCGNYRVYSQTLEEMYRDRKDDVEFLRVYVREAHPSDTRSPTGTNARAGILIEQPKTVEERCRIASRAVADLGIETPMVVDGMDNRVGQAYGGWPDRLYLIDRDGRVVYQGGPGPFAFNPRELEQSLVLMMLDESTSTKPN